MDLLRFLQGKRSSLNDVEKTSGNVYVCTDDGTIHFDYTDDSGSIQRQQFNAKDAMSITGAVLSTSLNPSNQEIPTSNAIIQYAEDNFAKLGESGDVVIDGEIKADNVPHIVEEVTLCIIPAATIQEALTNGIKKITIDAFEHDTSIIAYATYGGKEYASFSNEEKYLEFFVANPYVTDGFACGFLIGQDADGNADETKAVFNYRVLDTENVTDLVLTQLVVSTIDSKYFDHDFTIINSISMNRRGNIGVYSTALGGSCVASGQSSFATGLACEATGSFSTAVGKGSFATGEAGLSTGLMTTAGREAFSTGRYTEATGRGSLATGNTTKATGQYSYAEGQNTVASKTGAHVEGLGTLASSDYQHVQGKYNVEDTSAKYAYIIGNGTSGTARRNVHTIDWNGNVWFSGDAYVGSTSGMNKDEGSKKLATEEFITTNALIKAEQTLTDDERTQVRKNLKFIGKDVEGQEFTIDGTTVTASPNAEIFGDYETNIAVGQWSIAEGSNTIAKGRASHAEGAFSQALNDGCHVEGYGTKATGYWSHAEGEMTIVTSYASHAEGSYTTMPDGTKRYSTAAGYASHTEGGGCHTNGTASHAEGIGTTANGRCAHVEGTYNIASGKAQHVEGIANIEDTEDRYIHIAGNGTTPADRSNAYTLDWNGTGWFKGGIKIGGTNQDDASSLYTQEQVDALVEEAVTWGTF